MQVANKILLLVGGIFLFVGSILSIVFLSFLSVFGTFAFLPLIFVVLGIGLIIPAISELLNRNRIMKNGNRYEAKIYSYVEDKSVVVNDAYPFNVNVHYFDKSGIEKEAILKTGFCHGSNDYPIGMTIIIYELNGKFTFDKKSVSSKYIDKEEELMDDIPINTYHLEKVAVECKGCGAPFSAVKGYVAKCPYCGRSLHV